MREIFRYAYDIQTAHTHTHTLLCESLKGALYKLHYQIINNNHSAGNRLLVECERATDPIRPFDCFTLFVNNENNMDHRTINNNNNSKQASKQYKRNHRDKIQKSLMRHNER